MKIKVWIIADKKRKVVACGSPRNRELCFVEGLKKRVMTYGTRSKAVSGFTTSGFFTYDCDDYLRKEYGFGKHPHDYSFLEPVECELSEVA